MSDTDRIITINGWHIGLGCWFFGFLMGIVVTIGLVILIVSQIPTQPMESEPLPTETLQVFTHPTPPRTSFARQGCLTFCGFFNTLSGVILFVCPFNKFRVKKSFT